MQPANIILTRNDGIGDMVLTLPMAAVIKQHFPQIKVAILGKAYTKALVLACSFVDEFIDENDFFAKDVRINNQKPAVIVHVRTNKQVAKRAKQLNIPIRIGTSSRWYHWFTCNKLVALSRKKSALHEAQLNIKLLAPLGIKKSYSTEALQHLFGLNCLEKLEEIFTKTIDTNRFNVIIHPKSQGSSREWPITHFIELINILDEKRYNIFLSGVEKERPYIQQIIDKVNKPVQTITVNMPLGQFISFIKSCDAIVANATGPIHMGAALGIHALGLYPPLKPIHPGRWAPLGKNVHVFVLDKNCTDCSNTKNACSCMNAIAPQSLKALLDDVASKKTISYN
ncbi:glycosyltransferase family 9 protein [Ferruginibacter yonginensis]|uniref:Glycosyltransferase family 9 protein n=1 Tax=Ferruginibacter yonginensis TaxID=1310416 RepID=A0ABV8QS93_9BACT